MVAFSFLRGIEKWLGIAAMLSSCIPDTRDPSRIVHTHADMVRARVFAIASGYEDCDDLDGLRIDPAFKMASGRRPETGMGRDVRFVVTNLPGAAKAPQIADFIRY
jgi:hypothetical protein